MADAESLNYIIKDPIELNLSYMPFISGGGLFIPTDRTYRLEDTIIVDLQLPWKKDVLIIEGKIIWITPQSALYHVLAGIGIQFTGANALAISTQIEAELDKNMEVGGYTYGITQENK